MKNQGKGRKSKRGRPRSPKVEILDLKELKKRVRQIKKRKSGLYRRKTKSNSGR